MPGSIDNRVSTSPNTKLSPEQSPDNVNNEEDRDFTRSTSMVRLQDLTGDDLAALLERLPTSTLEKLYMAKSMANEENNGSEDDQTETDPTITIDAGITAGGGIGVGIPASGNISSGSPNPNTPTQSNRANPPLMPCGPSSSGGRGSSGSSSQGGLFSSIGGSAFGYTGRGGGGVSSGYGGRSGGFGRGGSNNTPSTSIRPTYTVKHSTMGIRPVPRDLAAQDIARVQLSHYDCGTGNTRLKHMEHATKPMQPPLACSNYSRLLSINFDSMTVISNDVHLWQESIRQIYANAYAYDMHPIFLIPDTFDLLSYSSTSNATRVYDGIREFNHPDLTDEHYFDWQVFVRTE